MPPKKPNFLFVMLDQLSQFVLPIAQSDGRNDHIKAIAPNLVKLAKDGHVFRNCYSNSPLCAPARATLMTAQPVRKHGVCTNGDELSASMPTFLHGLQNAGYETMLSGKMHFVGPDQLHGFDDRLTTDIYPSDFVWSRDWAEDVKHEPGTSVVKLDVPGVCKTNTQIRYDLEAKNRAIEYLHDYALGEQDKPFFLLSSFTQPHEPFMTTQKYWEKYESIDIPVPADGDPSDIAGHPFNEMLNVYHGIDHSAPDSARKKNAIRAHLAMISHMDDYLGELLETLDLVGLRENTVVIFTSDHGEMLGSHGMWFKRTFYEESVHVPLVIRVPGGSKPGIRDEIVSLADLGPTILELAEAETKLEKFDVMGRSFAGLVDARHGGVGSNRATVDYLGDGTNTPMFMIREREWKYVAFHEYAPILFNLDEDPHEMRNLASDEAYADIVAEMRKKLLGGLSLDALVDKVKSAQKARIFIQNGRAASKSERLAWDYQPRKDPTRQYVRAALNSTPYR